MKNFLSALAVIVILSVISSGFYAVGETDQVIITQFGRPVGAPIREPGVIFKIPFIQTVNVLDKRILEWDGESNQIPSLDKKYIYVDATARWRIIDPLKFLETVQTEQIGISRLDDIIDSAVRTQVSSNNLIELVRNSDRVIDVLNKEFDAEQLVEESTFEKVAIGREKITRQILKSAAPETLKFGVELIDVRIKGVNYEESVQQKVFSRMISERNKIAQKLRSEGLAEKSKIQGRMNLDLKRIESEAYRKAQEIKGTADAKAAKIYADAYNADPDLYEFLAKLEAYDEAITKNSTLVLSTDSEFFADMQ